MKREGRRKKGTPIWWILKQAAAFCAVAALCIFAASWLGEAALLLFLFLLNLPMALEWSLLHGQQRGNVKYQKGQFAAALASYQKGLSFLSRHQWINQYRNWLFMGYYRNSLEEELLYSMALCCLHLSDRQGALKYVRMLQSSYPIDEEIQKEFSYLEGPNYEKFQKENEGQMSHALSGLLEEGEALEYMFYAVVWKKNKKRFRNQPCFVGKAAGDLLLAAFHCQNPENILWALRFPMEISATRRKKGCTPDSYAVEIQFANGDIYLFQFSEKLFAGQYAGQGENVRLFLKGIGENAEPQGLS